MDAAPADGDSVHEAPPDRAPMDEALIRSLTPGVLTVLVRRGADFAAAEDAVQDALVEAVRGWPADPPRDPKGWLVTVAWRRFLDAA
ncbi:RNA polymerase sigma factor, partial [Streptomyces coelicoflavus ZG0656]